MMIFTAKVHLIYQMASKLPTEEQKDLLQVYPQLVREKYKDDITGHHARHLLRLAKCLKHRKPGILSSCCDGMEWEILYHVWDDGDEPRVSVKDMMKLKQSIVECNLRKYTIL